MRLVVLTGPAPRTGRWRRACRRLALLPLLALALGAGLSGCAQLDYLGQAAGGHLRIVAAARPVNELLADPALEPGLQRRLVLSQRIRAFAVSELHLPDNASYRRYAELGREAAVWNVVAAPELSLTLRTWCYPLMGCAGYRGYFDRAAADVYAEGLRGAGLEVLVYGVPAYSTLGWGNWLGGDPLLSSFLRYPEGELARMIFHELAHQVAYAADDTEFNESFATAVERLGVTAWLAQHADAAAQAQYRLGQQRRAQFRALTTRYRLRLAELYASAQDEPEMRAAKAALMAEMRAEHQRLKREDWGGWPGYDRWFEQANNASFAILAAYDGLVPQFEALFERQGRRWPDFLAEVGRLAGLPREQRRRELQPQGEPHGRHPDSPPA